MEKVVAYWRLWRPPVAQTFNKGTDAWSLSSCSPWLPIMYRERKSPHRRVADLILGIHEELNESVLVTKKQGQGRPQEWDVQTIPWIIKSKMPKHLNNSYSNIPVLFWVLGHILCSVHVVKNCKGNTIQREHLLWWKHQVIISQWKHALDICFQPGVQDLLMEHQVVPENDKPKASSTSIKDWSNLGQWPYMKRNSD